VQYQSGTGGNTVKKTPDLEDMSLNPQWGLGALTKSGKTLGVRSFYKTVYKVSARRVHNALLFGKGECRINGTNMPQQ
jgi:hypothetical protein